MNVKIIQNISNNGYLFIFVNVNLKDNIIWRYAKCKISKKEFDDIKKENCEPSFNEITIIIYYTDKSSTNSPIRFLLVCLYTNFWFSLDSVIFISFLVILFIVCHLLIILELYILLKKIKTKNI